MSRCESHEEIKSILDKMDAKLDSIAERQYSQTERSEWLKLNIAALWSVYGAGAVFFISKMLHEVK